MAVYALLLRRSMDGGVLANDVEIGFAIFWALTPMGKRRGDRVRDLLGADADGHRRLVGVPVLVARFQNSNN